jgi:N-acetylmuramic acid 6-phosphate (MurNAc-6-P) etherase
VADLAGTTTARAEEALARSGYHIAAAILMARRGLSPEEAEAVLRKHEGCLRDALSAEDGDNP